jgi:NAD(P)H-nitrite reductase large subunit
MTRYVILGMGVAGMSAAETLRALDRSAEIVVVSDDPHGFYSRPGLAYYLSDEIPPKKLYLYTKSDWKALNVRHIKGRATRLGPQAHQIEISPSGILTYDRLLLATGSTAVPINVPGERLKGVVKLDDFEDTRQIISLVRRTRSAVVVGGGIVALELVEGLVRRGVQVHYFMRGDRYWANVLDEAESRLVEHRLAEDGVHIHYQTEIAEILGRGKVTSVKTKKGEIIRCGMVAVGIGIKARMELAQAAGLATERGILANEYLQTSNADIFAAGDAAQVRDLSTGRALIDTLWWPGREQGRLAALNMAGQRQPYFRSAAVNVVRLVGVMLSIIGTVGSGRDEDLVSVARGSSETWLQLPNTIALESGNEFNHLRLMIGEQTLLGALVLGEQKLSLPLQELVTKQIDITPIRPRLLQPGAPLGQILMDFWSNIKG